MNWYLGVLKNYAGFSGRAHRTEFWMFVLFNLIISFVIGIIDVSFGLVGPLGYGVLGTIYSLGVLVPSIAVAVRRLHDTNRSGLWYLLILVPVIGAIALIIFCAQESQPGDNQFGPSPRAS